MPFAPGSYGMRGKEFVSRLSPIFCCARSRFHPRFAEAKKRVGGHETLQRSRLRESQRMCCGPRLVSVLDEPRITLAVYAHDLLRSATYSCAESLCTARKLVQRVETGFLVEIKK
jgi:hypothetical protein